MFIRKNLSQNEWNELWLNKYSDELVKRNLSAADARWYYAIVKQYLAENPGNPRGIGIPKIKRFVARAKEDVTLPLILFYDAVASSDSHLAALVTAAKKKRKGKKKER